MFSNPLEETELYDKYGVDYIFISDQEWGSYQIDESALQQMADCIYEDGSVKIYQRLHT